MNYLGQKRLKKVLHHYLQESGYSDLLLLLKANLKKYGEDYIYGTYKRYNNS